MTGRGELCDCADAVTFKIVWETCGDLMAVEYTGCTLQEIVDEFQDFWADTKTVVSITRIDGESNE